MLIPPVGIWGGGIINSTTPHNPPLFLNIDPGSTNPICKHVNIRIMSYTEKIDVLELLISIIHEHEKKLDELITRIEAVTPRETPTNIP